MGVVDPAQFWAQVARSEDCWLWQGEVNRDGYGHWRSGVNRKRAHRVAFELAVGPIPDGLFVCHHCDTPLCCRPDHLFLGTAADNARDRDSKERQSPVGTEYLRTHGRRAAPGERHHSAKLTAEQVATIRSLYEAPERPSQRELARRFGVSQGVISRITTRTIWATP